jgi:hypothetical protein
MLAGFLKVIYLTVGLWRDKAAITFAIDRRVVEMNERIKSIERDGIKKLFVDYSNLEERNYIDLLHEYRDYMVSQPADQVIPTINDITNTFLIENIKKELDATQMAQHDYKAGMSRKNPVAVIGVTGIKKMFANMIFKEFQFVNNPEDGIRYIRDELEKS